MTDTEITELNEAVARKLGWTLEEHKFLSVVIRCRCISGKHWYRNGQGILPNYVGDIGAAWEIVHKLGLFDLRYRPDAKRSWGIYTSQGEWESDTAPMAICLALLKLP